MICLYLTSPYPALAGLGIVVVVIAVVVRITFIIYVMGYTSKGVKEMSNGNANVHDENGRHRYRGPLTSDIPTETIEHSLSSGLACKRFANELEIHVSNINGTGLANDPNGHHVIQLLLNVATESLSEIVFYSMSRSTCISTEGFNARKLEVLIRIKLQSARIRRSEVDSSDWLIVDCVRDEQLLLEVVMVVCETSSFIWARHVQICFDIPEGLSYLQNNMNDKLNVIHRDIKSANIVLDDAWDGKDRQIWPL
ncbi:kinase-like domain, phloem protein 2-like protein [Tanacetum coccineum]